MKYCSHCGKELSVQTDFCPHCGKNLKSGSGFQNRLSSSNIRLIIKIGAFLLCVMFFTTPLVRCSFESNLNATGMQIATGTGMLYDESGEEGNLFAFVLIIAPAVLLILAFANFSFSILRNASVVGLAAKIVFLIGAYLRGTEKQHKRRNSGKGEREIV